MWSKKIATNAREFMKDNRYEYYISLLKTVIKMPERFVRRTIVKPLKAWLNNQADANENASSSAEIISLSTQKSNNSSKQRAA